MNQKHLLTATALIAALGGLGCLRSYNASPLSPVSLNATLKSDSGLELQTKAEITEKFGTKLAEDREVIPVQVQIQNKGTDSFKVLRTRFQLVESRNAAPLPALTSEETYQLGRHGYGAPVCGLIFGGPLGAPSLVTTIISNNRILEDYQAKLLQDALLEPGKSCSGTVFFDPAAHGLSRGNTFKLVVEVENARTGAKVNLEQPQG